MHWGWPRTGRRAAIEDAVWEPVIARCPMLANLGADDLARLRDLAERFVARKSLEGAGGLMIDASMATSIAAQACVPLIGLDLDWYDGWRSVIVYPGDFVTPHQIVDEAGVVHEGSRALAGEAWHRGPIVLSWEGVERTGSGAEWGNLVIHECAHKLDMLDGDANGLPPLASATARQRWRRVMREAFAAVRSEAHHLGEDDILVEAAEDPGEFFAVISEWLFTEPETLREDLPDAYTELVEFYGRDPAG